MREILFRGKDVQECWHIGLLAHIGNGWYISNYEVVPETVGQYTGLTDKNGKKIFEGDYLLTDLKRPYNIVVFRNGCFMLSCNDGDGDYYDTLFPLSGILNPKELTQYDYGEVIGNIHNSPELLKGGAENA